MSRRIRLLARWSALVLLPVSCMAMTGCQLDVGGQTLPSPYYLYDDVQYFPAGSEFKLANEAAAMKAFAAEETLQGPPLQDRPAPQ